MKALKATIYQWNGPDYQAQLNRRGENNTLVFRYNVARLVVTGRGSRVGKKRFVTPVTADQAEKLRSGLDPRELTWNYHRHGGVH